MTEAAATRSSQRVHVQSTYKARDVEGFLDIYFYRPVGFALARGFAALQFTPSAVSLLGAAIGVTAGHFYYYSNLRLNALGMALHVVTNALDNADGQLARLTNQGSLTGAVVDGIADYVVFISVYVHLCLRHIAEGGSRAIWLIAALAGASHALQSLIADCYRDSYLFFVNGKGRAEPTGDGVAMKIYNGYARQQKIFAPQLAQLREKLRHVPESFAAAYREKCRPLIGWGNLFATNTRMLLLFALLLLGAPSWYFVVEITVMNALLLYVVQRHRAAFKELLAIAAA